MVIIDKASLDDYTDETLFSGSPLNKYIPSWPVGELFYASSYDEFIIDANNSNKKARSNDRVTNLYDSTMKVIKSTYFELEEMRNLFNNIYPKYINSGRELVTPIFNCIQPLIIFRGNLYGYVEDETPKFRKIKYAQLPKRYISKNYRINNGMIHVVDYEYLEEYLSKIWQFYNIFSNKIVEDQSQLINSIIPDIIQFLNSNRRIGGRTLQY